MPLDIHFFLFSLPPAPSRSLRNASHSSSSALASFAQIYRLPSTSRFFDADADDHGFPVRTFFRVRTFQLLPRPSADLRQFNCYSNSINKGSLISPLIFEFFTICVAFFRSIYGTIGRTYVGDERDDFANFYEIFGIVEFLKACRRQGRRLILPIFTKFLGS